MEPIIEVQDISMRFNLASERTDWLKEYFVKKMKDLIQFEEFYALRSVRC